MLGLRNTIVVNAHDTDVLLLLVAHCNTSIKCKDVGMKAGFISVKEVIQRSGLDTSGAKFPLFHSLTGSDTLPFLPGHSKETALKSRLSAQRISFWSRERTTDYGECRAICM